MRCISIVFFRKKILYQHSLCSNGTEEKIASLLLQITINLGLYETT